MPATISQLILDLEIAMHRRYFAVPLILALGGCALSGPSIDQLQQGRNVWAVGCNLSFTTALSAVAQGKQTMSIDKPCDNLDFRSLHSAPGSSSIQRDQIFQKIIDGKTGNWAWELSGTPSIVQGWAATTVASNVKNRDRVSRASWSALFHSIRSVYSYVLHESPPTTQFNFYLFPASNSISKTVTTSTKNLIDLHFYIPYYKNNMRWRTSEKSPEQTTYMFVRYVSSFEYVHTLFFTNRLKVPNLLGQSVAGAVIRNVLRLITSPSGADHSMTLPSTKTALALAKKKRNSFLNQGDIDGYGAFLATANMAHALGADTEKITIHTSDKGKVIMLLKLARAMLQNPVDFTKTKLYPLDKLDSIPAYQGLNAGTTSAGGSRSHG